MCLTNVLQWARSLTCLKLGLQAVNSSMPLQPQTERCFHCVYFACAVADLSINHPSAVCPCASRRNSLGSSHLGT